MVIQFIDQSWNPTNVCSDKHNGPMTFVRIDMTLYREQHWMWFQ